MNSMFDYTRYQPYGSSQAWAAFCCKMRGGQLGVKTI